MSVLQSVLEESLVNCPVRIKDGSDSAKAALRDLSLVALNLAAWGEGDPALSPHRPKVEVPVVHCAVFISIPSLPMEFLIFEGALVLIAIGKLRSYFPVDFVSRKGAFQSKLFSNISSSAMPDALVHFTLVGVSIFQFVFSLTVQIPLDKFSLQLYLSPIRISRAVRCKSPFCNVTAFQEAKELFDRISTLIPLSYTAIYNSTILKRTFVDTTVPMGESSKPIEHLRCKLAFVVELLRGEGAFADVAFIEVPL